MQLKLNLPNLLILFRIFLIPVFLVFFLNNFRVVALVVFLIAAVSDFFDGYLARRWKTVSNFGKLMDPLADKMLVSAALVALVYVQELAAWAVIVIICREFWVTSLRMLALEQGGGVTGASTLGKIKTTLQMAMIIAYIGNSTFIEFGQPFLHVLMYMAVIATVLSAAEYTKNYKDVFKA